MGEGETVGSVCEWEGEGLCVCVCEGDYVGVGGVECEMSVRWGISPHDQTLSLIFSQLCMCG